MSAVEDDLCAESEAARVEWWRAEELERAGYHTEAIFELAPRADVDSKFTREFDEVFRSEAIRVIKVPVPAPKARAHAERWVGTTRRECLDRILIVAGRHLQHVLAAYVAHYNEHRPHRALQQRPPLSTSPPGDDTPLAELVELDRVRRRDVPGGLIHEYELAA